MDKILIVNKEENLTSRDVVNILCKKFNTRKIGHTGTLDPIATGVLVTCFGKALKVVDLITSYKKEYIARVILGFETDTLDVTGKVLYKDEKLYINKEMLEEVLSSFLGKSIQEVPKYSSVKVNGKKLYQYARNNEDVLLPKREIEVFEISLLSDLEKVGNYLEFSFKVLVSKGTYIRSLIRDIGRKLNSYATMKQLVRTKQGNFDINNSYTISDIENDNYRFLDIKDVLDIEKIVVDDEQKLQQIKNGAILDKFFKSDIALVLDKDYKEIGIYMTYDKDKNKSKPYKIF